MRRYLFPLVFLSGAAALTYEVVWSRQLATFLGIASYAHAVVLATFMGGLALGSRVLGGVADRVGRPLALFASLELGIGLFALAAIRLIPELERIYGVWGRGLEPGSAAAHGLRFAMAGAALALPTFLMGGTLPALVRGASRLRTAVPRALGGLYGVNTLGAAAGGLAAGYLFLPALGTRGTLLLAVAANLLVALSLLPALRQPAGFGPAADPDEGPAASPLRPGAGDRSTLLAVLGLSGLAALAAQLAWVRALTLVLGSSVYAFSLTLGAFLAGVALGSLAYGRWLAPRLDRRRGLGWAAGLEALTGLTMVAGLPLIGRLPEIFLAGHAAGLQSNFALSQLFGLLLAWAVLLLPTLALGALFPLLTSLAAPAGKRLGRDVGTAAAVNGIGTILGAGGAGLLLLPTLGVSGTLMGAAGLHVLSGGLLWRRQAEPARRRRRLVHATIGLAAFGALTAALPPWDRAVMTSGPFINAARILDVPEDQTFREWIRTRNRVLFYAEGADGNVSVRQVGEERLLVINGKTDGSRLGDRKTQLVVGYLPLMMHGRPSRVLVVGLGTGMTAAAVAADGAVERIDVLELSPEVVEASRFFLTENRGVLLEPRTHLIRADARNHLHTTDRLYDVIVAEPSNPWISGVSNLFTREFFHLALERLALGGVMSQWFHTYAMSETDLRTILATYEQVFPYVTVWVPQIGDLVLIGSRTPHRLRLNRLTDARRSAAAILDLAPHDLLEPVGWARMFLFDAERTRSFVAGAPLNTDDHPRVEFSAPRNLYRETTFANMTRMVEHLAGEPSTVPFAGLARPSPESFRAFGLEIAVPPEVTPEASWLVSWTAPIAAEPGEIPRFAVGNRRVIRFGDGEILCAASPKSLEPEDLLRALEPLLGGETGAIGSGRLADGTAAVWAATDRGTSGLAWSCGDSGEAFSRYLAIFEKSGIEAALEIAGRLRCAAEPTGLPAQSASARSSSGGRPTTAR